MDAWFVWFLIFLGITGAIFLGAQAVRKEFTPKRGSAAAKDEDGDGVPDTIYPRSMVRKAALVPLGIAVFLLIMSCWSMVSTNHLGIFTSMGRPYTAADNGFEFKRPWAKVTEMDASRQFLRFCADGNNEESADKKEYRKVSLRIDGNATADICGVVAWQMKAVTQAEKDQAIQLFKDYKVFDRVTTNHVYPSVKVALSKVLANQNPLLAEKNMTVAQINEATFAELRKDFGGTIIVLAVDISVPDYDAKTDEAIAADLAQKAKTSLEKEKEKTNLAAALANAAIAKSIQDPQVLINKCLDIAKELGYNPGLCMMSGNGVILPGDALARKPA